MGGRGNNSSEDGSNRSKPSVISVLIAVIVGVLVAYPLGGFALSVLAGVSGLAVVVIVRFVFYPANWGQTRVRRACILLLAGLLGSVSFSEYWFTPVINSVFDYFGLGRIETPPFWEIIVLVVVVGAIIVLLNIIWTRPLGTGGGSGAKTIESVDHGSMGLQAEHIEIGTVNINPPASGVGQEAVQSKVEQGEKIYTAKLPVTGSKLFGREEQLVQLDEAWGGGHCHILSFVAFGGVGKTALVNEWLGEMERKNWDGARRVYGWSFYSQGTKEDRQASGDTFLVHALEWFGDKETAESSKSAWDKGVRLAELIRQEKTLLILDGLEPLQYPPGPMQGKLKDQGLQALLRELCSGMNGLCVISTREKIKDFENHVDHAVKREFLEALTPKVGMEVLLNEGVKGTNKELKEASKEFGGHALALTLLGNYLSVVHEGEIRKRDLIPHLTEDEEKGGHARRVMQSYENWLKGSAELDILYLMGLFDRPAEMGAIEVLRAEPVIEGLTENLTDLSDTKWKYAIKRLRDLGMLAKEDEEAELDCHPLVREHFGEKLEEGNPEAWQEAHERLYEYYKGMPEKELPDTVEEMAPLFRAVYHGCQAGKVQETLDEVYYERIMRKEDNYNTSQLATFGSDLGAMACFFERCWDQPAESLTDFWKAAVLSWAGFGLRAVGRLREAAEPMGAGMEASRVSEDWRGVARDAGNLSEVWLIMGEVSKAVDYGRESVKYADRDGGEWERIGTRTNLAEALHAKGFLEEANEEFHEAECILCNYNPSYTYLFSIWGYRFSELLLDQKKWKEVKQRSEITLKNAEQSGTLFDIPFEHLSIGRALMGQAVSEAGGWDEVSEWLNKAMAGLREAGQQWFLPPGLLARAGLWRVMGEYGKAEADLAEAREIAERGEMGLYLADCGLEGCRLGLAQGDRARAKIELAEAERLIEKMGYHRRDGEVGELKGRLV